MSKELIKNYSVSTKEYDGRVMTMRFTNWDISIYHNKDTKEYEVSVSGYYRYGGKHLKLNRIKERKSIFYSVDEAIEAAELYINQLNKK